MASLRGVPVGDPSASATLRPATSKVVGAHRLPLPTAAVTNPVARLRSLRHYVEAAKCLASEFKRLLSHVHSIREWQLLDHTYTAQSKD